ncbi:hypothetical protein [Siphonobacter sp. BAB-5385]|uniref:hypothetical protein n=1 Tax=Siphonobacter sp. BAB-5385 TaxID=1864822 RepID=UPI001C3CA0EE|nr:hypothetical protein [Siphonobacter sp. BAB-5385]
MPERHLTNLSWQQATTPVLTLNTIAALTYHIHYYIAAQLRVLQGQPLQASDRYSFDHPPIQSQEDWEHLLAKVWSDVETMAQGSNHHPTRCWRKPLPMRHTADITGIFRA